MISCHYDPASRTRPLGINIFAAAFLASALIAFLDGLWDIPAVEALLREASPRSHGRAVQ